MSVYGATCCSPVYDNMVAGPALTVIPPGHFMPGRGPNFMPTPGPHYMNDQAPGWIMSPRGCSPVSPGGVSRTVFFSPPADPYPPVLMHRQSDYGMMQPSHGPPGATMMPAGMLPVGTYRYSNCIPGVAAFRNRATPFIAPQVGALPGPGPSLDNRIQELNRQLAHRPEDGDTIIWYDRVVSQFFDDEATLTVSFLDNDGIKKFTIGRTLIPRFFRTMPEGGVLDVNYIVRASRETFSQQGPNLVTLESDVTMVTQHMIQLPPLTQKPLHLTVLSESRLQCDFNCDDLKIKRWNFSVHNAQEFINKTSLPNEPAIINELHNKPITRQGLSSVTVNYLKLCVILEPMQDLMSKHKSFPSAAPRVCLCQTVFQKFQRAHPQPLTQPMMMPPGVEAGNRMNAGDTAGGRAKPRRKRKGSAGAGTPTPAGGGGGKKKNANSPAPIGPGFSLQQTHVDVMMVGEPSLMGGDVGEEDERLISRLENTQFDPAVAAVGSMPPNGVVAGMPNNVSGVSLLPKRELSDDQGFDHPWPNGNQSPTPFGRHSLPPPGQSGIPPLSVKGNPALLRPSSRTNNGKPTSAGSPNQSNNPSTTPSLDPSDLLVTSAGSRGTPPNNSVRLASFNTL